MAQPENETAPARLPDVEVEAHEWQGNLVYVQEDNTSAWVMSSEEDTVEIER